MQLHRLGTLGAPTRPSRAQTAVEPSDQTATRYPSADPNMLRYAKQNEELTTWHSCLHLTVSAVDIFLEFACSDSVSSPFGARMLCTKKIWTLQRGLDLVSDKFDLRVLRKVSVCVMLSNFYFRSLPFRAVGRGSQSSHASQDPTNGAKLLQTCLHGNAFDIVMQVGSGHLQGPHLLLCCVSAQRVHCFLDS